MVLSDVSLDLAAGTGQTLEFGVKNLAKTFAGLTGELGESIPALKELTKEELMLGGAVDVVSEAFAGQALELTKVGLGPFEQLKMVLSDVSEEFGRLIVENIEPLKTSLQGLAANLRNLSTEQKETIIKIAGITAVVGPLLIILGKLVLAIKSVGTALIFLAANPMVVFASATAGLVSLLGFAILDLEGFIKTALNLGKVGQVVAKGIIKMASALGGMNKMEADAAIIIIDTLSKEQDKLADSMEGTTGKIEEQKKSIDKRS